MALKAAKNGLNAPGMSQKRGSEAIDKDAQDYILGYSQPSLAGLSLARLSPQDCVLGYSAAVPPGLRKFGGSAGAKALLTGINGGLHHPTYSQSCAVRLKSPPAVDG